MKTAELYQSLADFIVAAKPFGRPVIAGVNGVDGCGKTILTGNLAQAMAKAGHPACPISVDGFHHPRKHRHWLGEQSPEAYYQDSFDYKSLAQNALRPVFEARAFPVRSQTKLFDLGRDEQGIQFQEIDQETIVLVEGVFLFRPEILPYLQVKIFIDANFETILERVKIRDRGALGSEKTIQQRYERKYIPGQRRYLEDVKPKSLADIIIDNNDFESPKIIFP